MFRVYDKQKGCWITDNIYLANDLYNPYCNLYILKKNIFGVEKLKLLPMGDRYVYHESVEFLYDKNDNVVYVGDYVKAQVSEDRTIIGVVVFAPELSSYIILSDESDEWFALGNEICEYIEVIGNVFDGYDEDMKDGKQSL